MGRALTVASILFLLGLLTIPVCAVGGDISGNGKKAASDDLGEYHAILIGIDGYQSFNKLKTPVKDVEVLGEILKNQYGFVGVTILTDKTPDKPTATNILKFIREKAQRLTDKDNLLVYYAGHGYLDELTSSGYWIPINGRSEDPSTWISHDQIKSLLETNRVSVKNFILVADSCYSGGMRSIVVYKDTRRPGVDEDTALKELLQKGSKKSREVITSGGLEPVEDVVPGSDHSLFAHYLLKALKDNNNRYVDMQTLLHEKVLPEIKKWGKQTPEMVRVRTAVDEEGLFILTKAGIAEKSRKPNLQDEIARLQKENEALQRFQKENEALQNELGKMKDKQKRVEDELSQLNSKQRQLLDEKNRLDEIDKKNKADEQKLQAVLKEKDQMSSEKVAEIEREKQRIDNLNQQIDKDRKSLIVKERSVAETEALLQKQRADLNAKTDEQRQMSEFLERRKKELEEKEKSLASQANIEEERSKVASQKAMEAVEKAKIAVQKAKEEEERATAAALRAKAEAQRADVESQRAEAARQQALKEQEQARIAELQKKKAEEDVAKAQQLVTRLETEKKIAAGIIADSEKKGDWTDRFVVLDNIVFDKETNLMWLLDANSAKIGKDYENAEKYVSDSTIAGYNDWHVPTSEEWRTLIPKDVKGIEKAFPEGFPFKNIVIVGNYWVASTITGSSGINLGNGSMTRLNKKNPAYIWPVRYATPEEIMKIKTESLGK
jgi:hypothetical protein